MWQTWVCDDTAAHLCFKGGHESEVPESTPQGFCVFLSEPESKICEKPDPNPESLVIFGSNRSVRGLLNAIS